MQIVPNPARAMLAIIVIEGIALVALVVSVVVAGSQAGDGAGFVLSSAGVYALFLVAVVATGWGLAGRRSWSRGPFVVVQLFTAVAAWTLASGGSAAPIAAAVLFGSLAAIGLLLALLPTTMASLQGGSDRG